MQSVLIKMAPAYFEDLGDDYELIIAEELNVKTVNIEPIEDGFSVEVDFQVTPELKQEGLMREVVRQVQNARKSGGLQVDDRISLVLETDDAELKKAIQDHAETIKHETLAEQLITEGVGSYETSVKIEGSELQIRLDKSS